MSLRAASVPEDSLDSRFRENECRAQPREAMLGAEDASTS